MGWVYIGNATLYRPQWVYLDHHFMRFQPAEIISYPDTKDPSLHTRSAIFIKFKTPKEVFWSINTHLAWGPTPLDEPYKVKEATLLSEKIITLDAPFILSGDFNVTRETQTAHLLEQHGFSLTRQHQIPNTLNPTIHRSKHLFPKGLAVDYLIVHPSLHCGGFTCVTEPSLSDHFALRANFNDL